MATDRLRNGSEAVTTRQPAPGESSRDRLDIELMRIVAALGVICIHVTAYVNLETGPRSGAV